MISNLERFKVDLDKLISFGEQLHLALQNDCWPEETGSSLKQHFGKEASTVLKKLPSFTTEYQGWYSEAKTLIRQLMPDRLADFTRLYEKAKSRKNITAENYSIEDCLQGLTVTSGGWEKSKIVGPDAAIPHFRQQQAILSSVRRRFESSLFDIRQLVQADLFDSELAASRELARNKFWRAAGAMAGVVIERHLAQVCENHTLSVSKKAPNISDLNDLLKSSNVIDVPQWRFIQHVRVRLCQHPHSRHLRRHSHGM